MVYDIFEQMNANFANIQLATKLVRIARDTLGDALPNQMIWNGDSRYRINGVLNYPGLTRSFPTSSWPAPLRTAARSSQP